ncbi:MAG: hypothetical protein AB1589_09915 [Cyanobacteriota bacterium]
MRGLKLSLAEKPDKYSLQTDWGSGRADIGERPRQGEKLAG